MNRKNWKMPLVGLIMAAMLVGPALLFAGQNQGRDDMSLYGGKQGVVFFPHHLHQNQVKDCQTCHADFAQKEGALEAAVASGELKKKQVMNKTCLKCHRAMKKAKEKTGPTSCKACHSK